MMLPRSLSLRVLLNSSSNWRGPPKQATMTIKLRLREPGMMIFDGGGGGMGSNHRLVLFTHALCQLSYPAVDRSVASRNSGTPGGPSLAYAPMRRKQITTRQQRPSRHTVSSKESSLGVVRIAPSRVVRGCYRRSRARRAANQGGHRRTRSGLGASAAMVAKPVRAPL